MRSRRCAGALRLAVIAAARRSATRPSRDICACRFGAPERCTRRSPRGRPEAAVGGRARGRSRSRCATTLRLYCKERLRISLDDYEILEAVAKLGRPRAPRARSRPAARGSEHAEEEDVQDVYGELCEKHELGELELPRSGPGRYVTVMTAVRPSCRAGYFKRRARRRSITRWHLVARGSSTGSSLTRASIHRARRTALLVAARCTGDLARVRALIKRGAVRYNVMAATTHDPRDPRRSFADECALVL